MLRTVCRRAVEDQSGRDCRGPPRHVAATDRDRDCRARTAAGPFVLIDVRDGATMREHLRARGIAVRRCDTFPGLGPDRLRVAVRPAEQVAVLIEAMKEIL